MTSLSRPNREDREEFLPERKLYRADFLFKAFTLTNKKFTMYKIIFFFEKKYRHIKKINVTYIISLFIYLCILKKNVYVYYNGL